MLSLGLFGPDLGAFFKIIPLFWWGPIWSDSHWHHHFIGSHSIVIICSCSRRLFSPRDAVDHFAELLFCQGFPCQSASCIQCLLVSTVFLLLALLSWLTTVTGHLCYSPGWPLSSATCAIVMADHCHLSLALLSWLTTVTSHLCYCPGWPLSPVTCAIVLADHCHRSLAL